MTLRSLILLPLAMTALALGMSTGQGLYYLLFFSAAALCLLGLITVIWLKATLKCAVAVRERRVDRGGPVHMAVQIDHRCPLPISEAALLIRCGEGARPAAMRLKAFKENILDAVLPTHHVGAFECGLQEALITDAFGLFRVTAAVPETQIVYVLPVPFEMQEMDVAAGDEGRSLLNHTQEDYASPEDVRKYQPGDALKRVHWKLSYRKQELLVRQYETPAPPDILLIPDPYEPEEKDGDREKALRLKDTVSETVCSVAKIHLMKGSPVRVPFYGGGGTFSSDGAEALDTLREMLARQTPEGQGAFDRILLLEARNMKKTGSVGIVTTRLTPEVVEAAGRLRQQGPGATMYYVTFNAETAERDPLVARLQHYMVEVCYVTP